MRFLCDIYNGPGMGDVISTRSFSPVDLVECSIFSLQIVDLQFAVFVFLHCYKIFFNDYFGYLFFIINFAADRLSPIKNIQVKQGTFCFSLLVENVGNFQ